MLSLVVTCNYFLAVSRFANLSADFGLQLHSPDTLVAPLCGLLPFRFQLVCRCIGYIVKCCNSIVRSTARHGVYFQRMLSLNLRLLTKSWLGRLWTTLWLRRSQYEYDSRIQWRNSHAGSPGAPRMAPACWCPPPGTRKNCFVYFSFSYQKHKKCKFHVFCLLLSSLLPAHFLFIA